MEKITQIIFWLILGCIGLVFIPDLGNSYGEPKFIALFLLSLSCIVSLCKRVLQQNNIAFNLPAFILIIILLIDLVSLMGGINNTGNALQIIGLHASALIIGLYVYNTNLSTIRIAQVTLFPVLAILFGAAAMILFRISLVSDYSPWGITVGLRNSVPVVLIQLLPFFLLASYYAQNIQRRPFRISAQVILFTLLAASQWVTLCYRTRSAWCMLIVYLILLVMMWAHTRLKSWRNLLLLQTASLYAAILLLLWVPTALLWNGELPYLNSLFSLASLQRSSGRDMLWGVAISMLEHNPLAGVGIGNYSTQWLGYISSANVDPQQFSLIRHDLPLFNDYLQMGVECGLFSMLLFVLFALAIPALYLVRLYRNATNTSITESLLIFACIATSVDAFVDYPFFRPETLLYFTVALNLVSKKVDSPINFRLMRQRLLPIAIFIALSVFLIFVLLKMYIGLGSKAEWAHTNKISYLERALNYWPWDIQWSSEHVIAFTEAGLPDEANKLVELRKQAWPYSPESNLMQALLLEKKGQFEEAVNAYRKAIIIVEGGKCYKPGIIKYLEFAKRTDAAQQQNLLSRVDLMQCKLECQECSW